MVNRKRLNRLTKAQLIDTIINLQEVRAGKANTAAVSKEKTFIGVSVVVEEGKTKEEALQIPPFPLWIKCPCGHRTHRTVNDLPKENTRMSCGNKNHWMVIYWDGINPIGDKLDD